MSNQDDQTIIRLRVSQDLKDQIKEAALKNNRSQSSEMVVRLESSFSEQKPDLEALLNSPLCDELMDRIADKLADRLNLK